MLADTAHALPALLALMVGGGGGGVGGSIIFWIYLRVGVSLDEYYATRELS